jgi:hypothetical protein
MRDDSDCDAVPEVPITLTADNALGVPLAPGVSKLHGRSLGDGVYLMVAPPAPGIHTIHFTGTFPAPINFTLDITYRLIVRS